MNSLHHQAVDRVGTGLAVSGRAADGGVEALEIPGALWCLGLCGAWGFVVPGALWCLGVQWHPELLPDDPRELGLFTDFVHACRDSALARL